MLVLGVMCLLYPFPLSHNLLQQMWIVTIVPFQNNSVGHCTQRKRTKGIQLPAPSDQPFPRDSKSSATDYHCVCSLGDQYIPFVQYSLLFHGREKNDMIRVVLLRFNMYLSICISNIVPMNTLSTLLHNPCFQMVLLFRKSSMTMDMEKSESILVFIEEKKKNQNITPREMDMCVVRNSRGIQRTRQMGVDSSSRPFQHDLYYFRRSHSMEHSKMIKFYKV